MTAFIAPSDVSGRKVLTKDVRRASKRNGLAWGVLLWLRRVKVHPPKIPKNTKAIDRLKTDSQSSRVKKWTSKSQK